MISREEIVSYLGVDWSKTKAKMREVLGTDVRLLQSVNDSLLANGGKMLRPLLCLVLAKLCGGGTTTEDSSSYAAAVELLHNATLLHDDVVDEASTRRGAPTVASAYGPTPAVLVGDFWLAKAVSIILKVKDSLWATAAFAKTICDLSEGEMLQQQKALSGDTTEADYLRIIYDKTASLFELSCMCAARSVASNEDYFEAARSFGKNLGIAFQIKDDILDYDGGDIGKPTGIDVLERKITIPLLGALRGSEREEEIREMMKFMPEHPDNSQIILKFVREEGGLEYAYERLNDFIGQAKSALEVFPACKEREFLEKLADYNVSRKK